MAICNQCGFEASGNHNFCPKCGNKLNNGEEPLPLTDSTSPVINTDSSPEQDPSDIVPTPSTPSPECVQMPLTPQKSKKKRKFWLIPIVVLALALIGGGVFAVLSRQPTEPVLEESPEIILSDLQADNYCFLCGQEYTVVFSVMVQGDADKVELYCNNSSVATMKDNGKNGDKTAGDGLYSCTITKTVDSDSIAIDKYQAKTEESRSKKVSVYNITKTDVQESVEKIADVNEDIEVIESEFNANGTDDEKVESAKEVYQDVVKYFDELVKDGTIIKYTQDKNTITALFYGITYVYVFDLNEDIQNRSSNNGNAATPNSTPLSETNTDNISNSSNTKEVVSIQPYASELSTTVFDDSAESVGELYGYSFARNVDDSAVTVDFMKTLDDYDVIIWDGHGGHNSTLHSFVGIGEPISNAHLYLEDTTSNPPAVIGLDGGHLGVTSAFFEKYYKPGDFDDTVIFMGACHTADDDVLANSFLDLGAAAYYGYENTVYTDYNRSMAEELFDALTEMESDTLGTKTVSDALDEAKSEISAVDNTINRNWWYRLCVALGWIEDSNPAVLNLICSEENEDFRLLIPTGTLAGKICKAADRVTPVTDAKVDVYKNDTLYTTLYSDSEGNYMVNLPVGSYRLDISAEGYIDFTCYATVSAFTCTYTETFLLVIGEENDSGIAEGVIRHALTGAVESGVTITVYESWNNYDGSEVTVTKTSKEGRYSLELPLGNYTIKTSKDGFVDCYFNIIVQIGTTDNQNGTITPSVSGDDFLITLTWGETPYDLDSHVEGELSNGEDFHVNYKYSENRDYTPNYTVLTPPMDGDSYVCRLDCDDIESYGPEHMTVHTTTHKPYYYYVYKFSNEGTLTHSNAHVTIHQGNNLIANFHIPTNQSDARYWNVFAIKDGEIIVNNTITNDPDLGYAD